MAEIGAAQVKSLRDRTGLGFMQCKEALAESGGDVEKAVDILRQKGLKSADKKADRATSQGRIAALVSEAGRRGVLVELDCESDFVARNSDFGALVDGICAQVAAMPAPPAAISVEDLKPAVDAGLKATIAKIGENIRLHRVIRYDAPEGGAVGFYVHPPGRIAVLMEVAGAAGQDPAKLQAVLKDLCMHVAATNPVSVDPSDIPEAVLSREQAVYAVQTHGKPPAVAEKMVKGKLEAFFSERCLVRQPFVKDPAVTVEQHLKAVTPGVSVRRFVRYEVGV